MHSVAEEVESDITPLPAVEWQGQGWHRRVNRKFVYALFDQGIVSFGNMVVSAAVSRNCAQGDFGVFILALRSLDVINQICNVFIWAPYTFNVQSMTEERQKRYLGSVLMHQVFSSAVALLLLLALSLLASSHSSSEYGDLFLAVSLPSLAIIFREFTRRMYFAHMRFLEALVVDTITVTLQVAGILYLIRRGEMRPSTALAALALSAACVCLYWFATEWKHIAFSWREVRGDLSLNMDLGKWFFGSNMLFLGSQQMSPWLLTATSGPTSVAALAVCEQVVNIPRVALASMQNAMAPTMARSFADGGKEALRKTVRRLDLVIISGSAVCAVGVMLFGPWISTAIFHKTPANSRVIFILMALNLLAYAASLAQSYGLSAINRADLNVYAGLFGMVAQLALAFGLVRAYGVPGVTFALLVGNSVVLAARIVYYLREMRRP